MGADDFNKNVLTYNPNRPITDYQGRIYISGAITGTTDYLKRFDKAERKYTLKGYEVINPAKVCDLFPKLEHNQYMSLCMPMLKICDTIVMLNSWETSKGAKMELQYALENEFEILVD
jgi:hypothetical protein